MKDFLKSVAFKVLLAIAALLIGIMLYAASTGGVATIPATVVSTVVTPLQSMAASLSEGFQNLFSVFTDAAKLREENAQLQQQLNEMREKLVEQDEINRKYELYKEFLGLKEQHPDYKFADAQVVAQDPSDRYHNFIINAGTLAGVKAGNPVITPAGLAGIVTEAGLNYSKVRTILDPSVQIGAYISRTRDSGITTGIRTGSGGQIYLTRLERSAGVVAGDYVVTLGGANKYPAGLLIGEVVDVFAESDGLSMTATIRPFADIPKLSNVFVITDFAGKDELDQDE